MQAIESYVLTAGKPEDRVLFQARLLLEPELREKTYWQQETYAVANEYGRLRLKEDIEQIANEIAMSKKYASFRQKILGIFSK
ncbi:hypothetical protein HYN59_15355 [Flavobacterium album]|uniref:Uncharacterized protein n=2 Tax=Flavobacterium album TaxID=2175091 RepID=A0A2S1R1I5_9FLAO|nr:hypothetical protein HYN59_15355 [Flavobacterium album]